MSTPKSVGDKTQGVPSTSKSGEMSPCPPMDLCPWVSPPLYCYYFELWQFLWNLKQTCDKPMVGRPFVFFEHLSTRLRTLREKLRMLISTISQAVPSSEWKCSNGNGRHHCHWHCCCYLVFEPTPRPIDISLKYSLSLLQKLCSAMPSPWVIVEQCIIYCHLS